MVDGIAWQLEGPIAGKPSVGLGRFDLAKHGYGFANLFCVTRSFDDAKLAALYPGGRSDYLDRFAAATSRACDAGFLLDADVDEIVGLAAASWPGPS